VANAGRFLAEAGARAVKVEGGRAFAPQIEAMVKSGIPVMGHIGLTPQHLAALGGYKVQGRTSEAVRVLVDDARAVTSAGCFSLVLEAMPAEAAAAVTEAVDIPTIGIGAGIGCDGQVQVINDILGWYTDFVPKHTKQYLKLADIMSNALTQYYREVKTGKFPAEEQSFSMDESILAELTN